MPDTPCPFCGEPMENGNIASGSAIWYQKDSSRYSDPAAVDMLAQPTGSLALLPAGRCERCGKVVVEVEGVECMGCTEV